MAVRPYWSGSVRISLVNLNVDLFTAIDAGTKVAFHQIYKPTGERVRQQLIAGDQIVERSDIVKGYEYEKGQYVLFDPDEINKLKIPSSKAMELVRFVPYEAVDPIWYDTPYYLAPTGKADQTTFAIIRESLRELKVMGLGQIVLSGRERLCAVKPCGSGLLLETLHYADEIKKSGHYFGDIKDGNIDQDEFDLAKLLIKRKVGEFKPEDFHDHYTEAVKELVDARVENRDPNIEPERPAAKVVNLMDALRKSLAEAGAANDSAPTEPVKKPAPRRKKAG